MCSVRPAGRGRLCAGRSQGYCSSGGGWPSMLQHDTWMRWAQPPQRTTVAATAQGAGMYAGSMRCQHSWLPLPMPALQLHSTRRAPPHWVGGHIHMPPPLTGALRDGAQHLAHRTARLALGTTRFLCGWRGRPPRLRCCVVCGQQQQHRHQQCWGARRRARHIHAVAVGAAHGGSLRVAPGALCHSISALQSSP